MPHFIIECPETLLKESDPEAIMRKVHDAAEATDLFSKGDIKVRIKPYVYYNIGNQKTNFIHIFGNVMEGRTTEQKAHLSKSIIDQLKQMFPDIHILSISIRDFEKSTYYNQYL